jgi:UDP-hydrolysing UDP-N-acetyl-D-glucosamine 2-epimerase
MKSWLAPWPPPSPACAGGDVTEGAFDESFRHAITKMAHVHFPTNPDAARRIRQLGEQADRVHVVGSPGLDLIRATKLPGRDEFFAAIGLKPRARNFIATFHPVTLASDSAAQLEEMLAALTAAGDAAILFTGANADPEGRKLENRVRQFAAAHKAARFVPSLGSGLYFAALAYMDAVIGNSSSGLYEAPSFGIPAVDIGDRQKGRLRAESVFHAAPERSAILAAINSALARGRSETVNPYGDGHASERILAVLKNLPAAPALLTKHFYDLATA